MKLNLLKFRMEQAFQIAEFSPCLKKKVGAVLLDSLTLDIRGKGFGGASIPCKECLRDKLIFQQDGCWSMHSELRTLFYYFNKYGFKEDLSNLIMLTTHGPCDSCIKYCVYFKIPTMIYFHPYKTDYIKWQNQIKIYQLFETGLKEQN